MTIYQKPDSLSLSGNIKDIILTDVSDKVTFKLSVGSTQILEHIYYPDADGRIVIDIRRFVEEQLSFNLTYGTSPWEQPLLARSFSFIAGNLGSQSFTAIRAGIDNPGETAANWLRSNFLTWQPTVKHVTYATPELLTYYADANRRLFIKVYYPNDTSTLLSAITLTAGAWTIPVSYAVIASRLGLTTQESIEQAEQLPGAYDVWIEDTSGNRLTYVQRYIADNSRENEQWILFENSLGGVDCFRAYGQGSMEAGHEHQLTDVDDQLDEYRVDTVRRFRKSTGWMDTAARRWLLDFFPSRRRWICEGGVFRSIVLTEDNATYTMDNMPAEFEFSFRYATSLAYLNVPRLLTPPSVVNIIAPDLQSFSLPPRLAEFPRLGLSEGALIPVQSPYSDSWAAISIAELLSGSSADVSRLERMINAEIADRSDADDVIVSALGQEISRATDRENAIKALLDDLFTKDISTTPPRIRANYSLYTNGHLSGMAGVAAGGITDPSSQGGGGGTAYTLSGDIPSANNLKLTLTSDDETLFPSSEVILSAEGLAEFVKSGTALKLRVTDANVWGAVGSHLLDSDSKILPTYLPDYLLGQVMYGGSVDASGVCTLTESFKSKYGEQSLTLTAANASLYEGVYFIASANGTSGIPQTLGVVTGDWVISNGTAWTKIDNTDAVASVNGKTGVVVLDKGDVGLGDVENTKLSTWAGSTNLTILGTIATGVWQGTPVADTYIASAATWNAKQDKIEDVTDTPQDYKYVSAVSQTNGKIAVTHTDFPIATTEHIGMVSILAQSFAGNKSFTGFVHSDADVIGSTGVAAGGITDPSSSGGGVTNYNDLDDRPLINGAVLVGGESISLQPTISNLATIIANAAAGKIASDNLGGHTVAKDVPADAEFTDTKYDDTALAGRVAAIETKDATFDAHIASTNNPHAVTKGQVGLGNVDNTADANKNVLSATKLTTARTLWGVSFDGSANITTAPDLYIGTTKVQTSSTPQNLTGIVTLTTSGKVTIGGGGLDVTGDIIAHSNIVLGDSTSNRSLYAYYLENDPIQMVGYNPDQGRIHFGYGAWAKEKAVTLEGNTIQFLSAAGTSHTMNFDASGNLGINVAAPQHRLDVGGDIFASAQIVGQTGVAAGGITDPTSSGGGGGGSVDAVKVNDVTYNPDASGVVELPNYYNKTESDTKYATKTALQTTNIAVGALDARLTTDEQNISGMSTDIYNLKGYFTNTGKAKDADKLDNHDSSYFAVATHTHDYLPLTGGRITGELSIKGDLDNRNYGVEIEPVPNGIVLWASNDNLDYKGLSLNATTGSIQFDDNELATQDWVTGRGYLTADALNNYYTKTESDAKYLTAASFDNYYNKSQSDARFSIASALTAPPSKREGKPGDFAAVSQNNAFSLYACFGQVSASTWHWAQVALISDVNAVGWANLTNNANSLEEGTSDVTDNTEILTSYASNNGFSDPNAVGKVYRRDAVKIYNYVESKLGLGTFAYKSSLAATDIPSLDASKITSGTFSDARIASAATWNAKQNALGYTPVNKAGDTLTGTLLRADNSSPVIKVYGNINITILDIKDTATSTNYGFELNYLGSQSGNNNSLELVADNQQGPKVSSFVLTQDGVFKFAKVPNVNGTNVALISDIPSVTGYATTDWVNANFSPIGHTHSQYQLASTAINTSNIGSQSVASANVLTTYAANGTDNLTCLQNIFASVPKSQATAVRLQHGSHSMAFGWFLSGYNYNSAYGGWFISDYGTPSWVGVTGGSWKVRKFAFTSDIPTNNNQLTNGAGYITGINSAMIINALDYVPADLDYLMNNYLLKSGGAITGAITYNGGGSWISARDHCAVKTTRTSGKGSDWHPVVGLKTSAGFWSFGSVGGENLAFSYDTDADYTAGRNTSTVINMPLKSGTIALTSDIPSVTGYATQSWVEGKGYITSSGSCAYATSAGNANTLGGNPASAFVRYSNTNKATADSTNLSASILNVEGETEIAGYGAYWYYLNLGSYSGGNYRSQIAMPYQNSISDTDMFIRTANGDTWRTWRRVLHSGNYTSYCATTTQGSHADTAYGWGNHASAGYAYASQLGSYLSLSGGTMSGQLNTRYNAVGVLRHIRCNLRHSKKSRVNH